MKKALICIVIALVMALPVGAGIMCLPVVQEWFASGVAYDCCFIPLFKALGSHSSETSSDIIAGTLYLVSFVLSLFFAITSWTIVSRLRRTCRQ
jgi:hypothetical protein